MAWYDMAWHGMTWHGMALHDIIGMVGIVGVVGTELHGHEHGLTRHGILHLIDSARKGALGLYVCTLGTVVHAVPV